MAFFFFFLFSLVKPCDICHRCRISRSRANRPDRDQDRKLYHFRHNQFCTKQFGDSRKMSKKMISFCIYSLSYLATVRTVACRSFTIGVGITAGSVRAHPGCVLTAHRLVTKEAFQTFTTLERTLLHDR